MKRALALVSMLLVLSVGGGCSSARHHTPEASQENFGVNMARMNLWREAMFRFKRAVQLNPNDAMAHNNLAVAYEANGDFDSAAKEYREAMRLDKSNQYIQKNYSRFVEFTSRNKKRQKRDAAPTKTAAVPETSAAAPAATPPATDTASPAPASTPTPVTDTAAPPAPSQPTPPPVKPPGDLR
jgi:Tfp pilus assembly protein PilF